MLFVVTTQQIYRDVSSYEILIEKIIQSFFIFEIFFYSFRSNGERTARNRSTRVHFGTAEEIRVQNEIDETCKTLRAAMNAPPDAIINAVSPEMWGSGGGVFSPNHTSAILTPVHGGVSPQYTIPAPAIPTPTLTNHFVSPTATHHLA